MNFKWFKVQLQQSKEPARLGGKAFLLFKQKVMCQLASCSKLLAHLWAVTQHEYKTRALSHQAPSTSSPSSGGRGPTKDVDVLLCFGGSIGLWMKQCRCMEMLRPRDTTFTREVPQLLVWPCNQDHLIACCGPSSSSTGDEVCPKTYAQLLCNQKRHFSTPTRLLQKQNWAEFFSVTSIFSFL